MKLQRYYDREKMDWQEKKSISLKSNDVCSHCGKFAFFGHPEHVDRLATIEHVIPISKGGSNHHINLVMLCEDCNKSKDRKIMPISWYAYLKDEYKKELNDYITNYLMVMETERTHLLSYDEYTFPIDQKLFMGFRGHSKKQAFRINVKMKRATWDEYDTMTEFLIKYLKKNDALDDEEAAAMNIAFWLTFGSIYYVEKNNEINCMIAITMKHVSDIEDYHGIDVIPFMYFFPMYSTDITTLMIYDMIKLIPDYICEEKGLTIMPASAILLKKDKNASKLAITLKPVPADIHNFTEFQIVSSLIVQDVDLTNEHKDYEDMTEEEKKTYNFTSQFKDENEKILNYLYKYSASQDIAWMVNCLISYSLIKDTELGKLVAPEEISNEPENDSSENE